MSSTMATKPFLRMLGLAVLLAPVTAQAQRVVHETKTAQVPAPTEVVTDATARSAPPPAGERDTREAALRLHHLPGPDILPAPPGAERAPLVDIPEVGVTATNITLVLNHALDDDETNDVTSQVDEPSVGTRGDEVLYTGNWYAAFSTNGGDSFSYVNPATTFPQPPDQPFCCDQVALYDPGHDLMIWFLQYVNNSSGNTARIAVAQGNDIPTQSWRIYDFTPEGVGDWSNEWFDFPDLAVGEDFLYVTTNAFTTATNSFTRAVILRLPLEQLAAYEALDFSYFDSTSDFSLRPTQGATDTMYFANHVSFASIRVFTWPESSDAITSDAVSIQSWSNNSRVAPGPDGRNWLSRADSRMTAAWLSENEIGFGWSASQDDDFQFPQVRIVILNKDTKAVIAQPHIWNSGFAFAYPAAATSSNGVVGISLHFGGGDTHFPSHAVGVLERTSRTWQLRTTVAGTHGPSSANRWGDYLAIRPHGSDPASFVATGFTQQGGPSSGNIEPRYIHFRADAAGPSLTVDLVNQEPDRRLGFDESLKITATVRRDGTPSAGEPVSFEETEGLVTITPDSTTTNAQGIVEATVTGQARMQDTARVTATSGGESGTTTVLVPDLSTAQLILLLAGAALVAALRRRSFS